VPSDFRCSLASRDRHEAIGGTATPARALLLLEVPGPWGRKALRDARLPEGLGAALTERADAAGVKVLLIRRPGRAPGSDAGTNGRRVFTAYFGPAGNRSETTLLADVGEVLDLDLAAISRSGIAGLEDAPPVYAVCTHGQRDLCCAEVGRPVATALAAAYPEETWEVSHLGGHRFAANLLLLPDGLTYGRVDADSALDLIGTHRAGGIDLPRLRGRCGVAPAVQVAEIAARERTGDLDLGSVRPQLVDVAGDVTEVSFLTPAGQIDVAVRTRRSSESYVVSCGDETAEPVTEFEVVSVGEPW
jgi:hypothetical protein